MFSHGNANNEIVNGSKRSFAVGAGTTDINLSSADDPTDPFITFGSGITNNSYWVGSKVITSEPLDQSVEVAYVDVANRRMHLNTPLVNKSISTLQLIPMRSKSLVGIKCRDFIQSSTGKNVRNRTQVYPTRLATGSTGN